MVSYCFILLCVKKIWWTYILRKGSDKMNELYHYGIKGQRWGVRRYQNADGSLTDAGQKRLSKSIIKDYKKTNHATTDRIMYKDRQVSNLRKNISDNDYNELRSLGKKYKSHDTDYYNLSDEAANAFDAYDKKVREVTDKLVGKYGNKTISWAMNKKLDDEVYQIIDYMSRYK